MIIFFKLCNLCGQLHIASAMLIQYTFIAHVVLHALPCKGLLWSTLESYFVQSPVLWVFCMPPCFFHSSQCFTSLLLGDLVAERDHPSLGGTSSSRTCLRPFTFLLTWIGCFDALKNFKQLEKLCSSGPPVSLYWPCKFLGTIQRMRLTRSTSSKACTTLVSLVACSEEKWQGNRSK